MKSLFLALFPLVLAAAPGCQTDTRYSQTQLNALQTREFDYPFDPTFDATVGALFDLGYTVFTSDKRGGLLAANSRQGTVQIKLDQAGPRRTSVRVSTGHAGQSHVDKTRIDQVLDTIDRRLTGHGPAGPSR